MTRPSWHTTPGAVSLCDSQACAAKEGSVTGPVPLGDVDGSGLDGIAVATCDPSADGIADRQVIICRSGYKNQATHLQVLDLPLPATVTAALEAEETAHHRATTVAAAATAAAAAGTPFALDPELLTAVTEAAGAPWREMLTPREVANVYTTVPIHQIACFEDLLVVTSGRSVHFYKLGVASAP